MFRALEPDYLMLLGSIDVIPHQDLANPVYADDKEDDPKAWSDLPYACDAAYSRDIADFVGPTRVVARLPDLTGARDPAHLLKLLTTATQYRTRPRKYYAPYFSISVRLWKRLDCAEPARTSSATTTHWRSRHRAARRAAVRWIG